MGLAARQALGRSSWFGIAYEKNQLSGFQGIKLQYTWLIKGIFRLSFLELLKIKMDLCRREKFSRVLGISGILDTGEKNVISTFNKNFLT